jgi:hypothetical protein
MYLSHNISEGKCKSGKLSLGQMYQMAKKGTNVLMANVTGNLYLTQYDSKS